jgi:Zn-dependent protease with chaperone function
MPAATLPDDQRLIQISPKSYEHPADRAATAALKSIPMLDTVVRKLIELGYERTLRQMLMANTVRISDAQLPEVWASHRAALARLDIDGVPDLYMGQNPFINASAIGSKKPMIIINSQTVSLLDEMELRTVLGHEAGHVLSDHMLYSTALAILLWIGTAPLMRLPFFAGIPLLAIQLALLEWYRAAELTCDRAATLVNRSPMTTCQTLMVMAGGTASRRLSLDAFIAQAAEYDDVEPGWDKFTRFRIEVLQTHPFAVKRVSELMKWVRSGEYDRIVSGEFRKRSDPVDPREEGGAAAEYYSEKFRSLFREFGDGISKTGDKAADAADKLATWLRRNESPEASDGA